MKKLFWWNLTKEEKYHRFLWSIPIWVAAVITVCIKSPYPHNLIELVLLGDTLYSSFKLYAPQKKSKNSLDKM